MNVVATDVGTLVEVQGTAEGATFSRSTLEAMMDAALVGIEKLTALQRAALAEPLAPRPVPAVEPKPKTASPRPRPQAAKQ